MMDTPAFLVWALEHSCPVRGFEDGTVPERVERHLRAARATSDALAEGRALDGLAVDPPNGFRIADALELYGGLAAVKSACRGCPANALLQMNDNSLAGCYGLVALPSDVERLVDAAALNEDFPATNPPWYGLWINTPIGYSQAEKISGVLRHLQCDASLRSAISELLSALQVAINQQRLLHIAHFPPGRVEGRAWQLVRHCPRCKAHWEGTKKRQCGVCGYLGSPAPDKKRQARGLRPYFPLARLLGTAGAESFLLKYSARRAQQALLDPAKSPPPPGRPDIPRAD